jgi:hypothetical protein
VSKQVFYLKLVEFLVHMGSCKLVLYRASLERISGGGVHQWLPELWEGGHVPVIRLFSNWY